MNFTGVTDPSVPFAKINKITRSADIVFGNLECCFFDKPDHDPAKREGFYAPPIAAEALVSAGFDAVGTANNVTYGEEAIIASLARLDALGIRHTGSGANHAAAYAPALVEKDGFRYGFVQRTSAYWPKNQQATNDSPGVAILKGHTAYRPLQDDLAPNRPGLPPEILTWTDPQQLADYRAEIATLSEDLDFLVASHHWGYKTKILDYQIEIAIARCQHGHVNLRCQFNHVKCDTNVPISLCGSVASLNKRLEFNFEADGLKDLLEDNLFRVLTIDRVGNRSNDLSSLSDVIPKHPIVEMATAALPDGVEDVLHIDEYRDLIHGFPVYVDLPAYLARACLLYTSPSPRD